MRIRTNYKLTFTATVLLMTASQLSLVQAADYPDSSQAAQPGYNPNYQNYQNYPPQNSRPYYGNRNYRRGSNNSPWGGSGPSFSGPWDGGRGNSMPWDSGRGGRGPSFSGPWDSGRGNSMPWDSGRGNNMPWDSGRGGSGPSFSGPWDSGRGNSMPW